MLSGLIPGLNSVNWPEDEVSDQFQASLINLLDLPNQFLSSFVEAYPAGTNVSLFTHSQRQHWSELGLVLEWRTLALCVYVGILVPMALLAWLHYEEGKYGGDSVAPLAEESPETNAEAVISDSMHLLSDAVFSFSALFKATGAGESVPESDVNHADDLQVQEPMSNGEPSSSSSSSQSCFCRICLENKQTIQMYRNQICSHSFCHDCTSKHIAAKIQENIKTVLCPGEDCTAALDFDACRQIIPKEVIVQWDEFLCKSMITKSQIIYCPFRDCSAMLVNDSGEIIEETNCPACKRSICARCHVPWHVEFTCKEFMRLGGKKRGKENMLVEELAKKKSWRKCPECEIYVEKTEGCSHITCSFFLLSLLLSLLTSSHSTVTNQSQFFTLMKNSLKGNPLSDWDVSEPKPLCSYARIRCNEQGYAMKIDISESSLSGRFPEHVCSYLPELQLNVSSAYLTGTPPDFSSMVALRSLDLSYNLFSVDFPVSVTNLTILKALNFNENEGFKVWQLPENISRLTKLKSMVLMACMIRAELGLLKNLQQLELYYKGLSGVIPEELGNLSELVDWDTSVNKLPGKIPESIRRLPNLKVLQLYNNSLTGEIPEAMANSTTLTILSVYDNMLTGEVPIEICQAANLVKIDLSNNLLSGPISSEIGNLGILFFLNFGGDKLNSSIPDSLFSLTSLNVNVLDLSNDPFMGKHSIVLLVVMSPTLYVYPLFNV
ncbi:hypothetical protein TEA_020805 [Camellia sinensis var. sinensis]|uniref:RING-type domain-containing protein n=1 Tax=Camellia sinensis var. sinensis TaxID=542762 RepID=A0A4S4D167_CAMSN|nr:hypothetical protein TEA_020805 [Camellia sinensis var. sinensis]